MNKCNKCGIVLQYHCKDCNCWVDKSIPLKFVKLDRQYHVCKKCEEVFTALFDIATQEVITAFFKDGHNPSGYGIKVGYIDD